MTDPSDFDYEYVDRQMTRESQRSVLSRNFRELWPSRNNDALGSIALRILRGELRRLLLLMRQEGK